MHERVGAVFAHVPARPATTAAVTGWPDGAPQPDPPGTSVGFGGRGSLPKRRRHRGPPSRSRPQPSSERSPPTWHRCPCPGGPGSAKWHSVNSTSRFTGGCIVGLTGRRFQPPLRQSTLVMSWCRPRDLSEARPRMWRPSRLGANHLGVPDGAVDHRGGEAIVDAHDEHGQLAAFPWQLGLALSGAWRDELPLAVSWSGGSRRRRACHRRRCSRRHTS